jgi:cytidine deaminase
MQIIDLKTVLEVYQDEKELGEPDRLLIREAQQATQWAYAPYSHFRVGAALLLEDGTLVKGSNQENAAYPSGLCAERTAIFWAGANHSGKVISAIAVSASREQLPNQFLFASPCGSCRQSMLEYENRQGQPIRLIMQGEGNKIFISPSIANLLPAHFSINNLSG